MEEQSVEKFEEDVTETNLDAEMITGTIEPDSSGDGQQSKKRRGADPTSSSDSQKRSRGHSKQQSDELSENEGHSSRANQTRLLSNDVQSVIVESSTAGGSTFGTMKMGSMIVAAMKRLEQIFANLPKEVVIDNNAVDTKELGELPYVNRMDQLLAGANFLLRTQFYACNSGDSKKRYLIFCAQLFGAGKTTFAKRLADGLCVLYGGKARFHYEIVEGLPHEYNNEREAVASVLFAAGFEAGVLSNSDMENRTDLVLIAKIVQRRLAANEESGQGVFQIFLHFDEFNLECSELGKYFTAGDTAIKRYYQVWTRCFAPLLACPNIHVVATGKPIALALIGHGVSGTSPSGAYHALLGTLKSEHLQEILEKTQVELTEGATKQSAADLLCNGNKSDEFLASVQRLTGGIPRFVCETLIELLHIRKTRPDLFVSGNLDQIFELARNGLKGNFYIRSGVGAVLNAIKNSEHAAFNFLRLSVAAEFHESYQLNSEAANQIQSLCDQFCCYVDLVDDERIKAVIPDLFHDALIDYFKTKKDFIGKHISLLEERASSQNILNASQSAGSIGDSLENAFKIAFAFHWMFAVRDGDFASVFKDLFLGHFPPIKAQAFTPVQMGRLMRGARTRQSVGQATQRVLSIDVITKQNLMLYFKAQSHSGDIGSSILNDDSPALSSSSTEGQAVTTSLVSPSEDTNVSPSAIAAASGTLLSGHLKCYGDTCPEFLFQEDVGKFGAMVASLSNEAKEFYTHRIMLFVCYPAGSNYVEGGVKYASGNQDSTFSGLFNSKDKAGENWFQVIEVPKETTKAFLQVPDVVSALHALWKKSSNTTAK